jgi:hypothetical protein
VFDAHRPLPDQGANFSTFHEDGRHVARTVPTGAIISVDSMAFDGNKLLDVTWDGKQVMMFAQDLRSRAEATDKI